MEETQILKLFAGSIRRVLRGMALDWEQVYEIRLRANRPLLLVVGGKERMLGERGGWAKNLWEAYVVEEEEIRETLEYVAGYSLYAFEEELRQGFLTVQGGHRVGVAGSVALDGGRIRTISPVTSLNVRLAHQAIGCGDKLMHWLRDERGIHSALIISPPRGGKTTLLRDMIRQISDGEKGVRGYTVGVVDERSELAGCYRGIPQNDLGMRTDVLDACPKAEGMMLLVRSMSPEVVAVDELGNYEDIHAIETVLHSGCRLLATMHGDSLEDILRKPLMERLVEERAFERYFVLKGGEKAGELEGVYDAEKRRIS